MVIRGEVLKQLSLLILTKDERVLKDRALGGRCESAGQNRHGVGGEAPAEHSRSQPNYLIGRFKILAN